MGSKSNNGADLVIDTNKNVNWMDSRGFWTFYALLLGSLYMATPVIVPSPHQWTFVNVLHGIVRTCLCVRCVCVYVRVLLLALDTSEKASVLSIPFRCALVLWVSLGANVAMETSVIHRAQGETRRERSGSRWLKACFDMEAVTMS